MLSNQKFLRNVVTNTNPDNRFLPVTANITTEVVLEFSITLELVATMWYLSTFLYHR